MKWFSFLLTVIFPLSYRWGSVKAVRHPGPLSGRHQPLSYRHSGLSDAETQPVPQWCVWLCQEEEVQHFPELQFHGSAPRLWEDTGPAQSVWQPFHQQGAALLHHTDQSQRLPAGHAGVNMRMVWTAFFVFACCVSGVLWHRWMPKWQYFCTKRNWTEFFTKEPNRYADSIKPILNALNLTHRGWILLYLALVSGHLKP